MTPETDTLLIELRPWPAASPAEVNEQVGGEEVEEGLVVHYGPDGLPHAFEVEQHASRRKDGAELLHPCREPVILPAGSFLPEERLQNSDDRPGGIPHHWQVEPTRKGGGQRYTNPRDPHDHVRVMPGNPASPNPAQRAPYAKRMKNGVAYDANHRPVDRRSPAAHVSLQDFRFRE